MAGGESWKWTILVVMIWIQAFTGTNFDFSAYSSDLKSVLGISQVQLNYLAVASDLGKVFGFTSGFALLYFPLSAVLLTAAIMGLVGYGLQWLVITGVISLPYLLVFLCCLLSGLSICWFNTVCFVLCIRDFPSSRSLALSLTVSFNGVSAALYTLAYEAINPSSSDLYLILNAVIPVIVSVLSLIPIIAQPSPDPFSPDSARKDSLLFLLLNLLAIMTGVYLLLFGSGTSFGPSSRFLFIGAIFLLILPLCIPALIYAHDWFWRTIHSCFPIEGSGFVLVDVGELEVHKSLISCEDRASSISLIQSNAQKDVGQENDKCCMNIIMKDRLATLGKEHLLGMLIRRIDFWLYFISYICSGTIGLVYSNNLGQIAQSLGQSTNTRSLVTLYSSFSFFGRLLSGAPDYFRTKVYFARTGWLALAILPTPVALFLLASSGEPSSLEAATALIGLSSGFIFAAAVSITSELFGPNSAGVNHNILITNIPIGSLIYGYLAAVDYEANARTVAAPGTVLCMGRECYFFTFVWWGMLSAVGLLCCLLLFVRTRTAYIRFEQHQIGELF